MKSLTRELIQKFLNFLLIKFLNKYVLQFATPAEMPIVVYAKPCRCHWYFSKIDTSQPSDNLQLHSFVKGHHRIMKSRVGRNFNNN